MFTRLALTLSLLLPVSAYGQEWQQVRGLAQDIAINENGDVYAAAADSIVWRWRNDQARWSKISGKLTRISIGPKGRVWGVGPKNRIYRRNGLWWDELDETAMDISVADDGMIVRTDIDQQISVRDKFSNRWKVIYGRNAVRVAASRKGSFWIIQRDASISHYDGKIWNDVEGFARDIAADAKGNIFIASYEGPIKKRTKDIWVSIAGTANAESLAVGPEENIWYVTYDGTTFASSLFPPDSEEKKSENKERKTSLTPAQTSDKSPIIFKRVNGKSARLAIGADGSIFSISTAGDLQRWSNKQSKFKTFPGTLTRIVVDKNGNPWGVNAKREIFKHNGKDWKNINGNASDIAIDLNGRVVISDSNENLYQLNDRQTSFKKIYGKGYYIDLHPNGEVWTIRRSGKMFRCTEKKCIRLKRTGQDMAIGPDGSVFMADTSNKLYQFDFKNNNWKRVDTSRSVRALAVGPKGRPWISDRSSDVFASTFFERDEGKDTRVASSTNKQTVVTSSASSTSTSVFSFSKNITFEAVTLPFAATDFMSIGLDGVVYFMGDSGSAYKYYKESTKAATSLDFSFPDDVKVAVNDADSKAWYLSASVNNKIGHQKKKDGSSFDTYTFDSTAATGLDLAIGGDGSVFAVSSQNTLYKYDASSDKFKKFDNIDVTNVAVDISGNPWVIEQTTQLVKYWDGSDFSKPKNKSQEATDIAIGATGKLYIVDNSNNLKKWNASNEAWDSVTISATVSNANVIAVDDDGRPWIMYTSSSGNAFRSKD